MSTREDEPAVLVRRVCRWCGETFKARRGEARGKGCPKCEPPLLPRSETVNAHAQARTEREAWKAERGMEP